MFNQINRLTKYLIFDCNWGVKSVWIFYSVGFVAIGSLLMVLLATINSILFAVVAAGMAGVFLGLIAHCGSAWLVRDYLETEN